MLLESWKVGVAKKEKGTRITAQFPFSNTFRNFLNQLLLFSLTFKGIAKKEFFNIFLFHLRQRKVHKVEALPTTLLRSRSAILGELKTFSSSRVFLIVFVVHNISAHMPDVSLCMEKLLFVVETLLRQQKALNVIKSTY